MEFYFFFIDRPVFFCFVFVLLAFFTFVCSFVSLLALTNYLFILCFKIIYFVQIFMFIIFFAFCLILSLFFLTRDHIINNLFVLIIAIKLVVLVLGEQASWWGFFFIFVVNFQLFHTSKTYKLIMKIWNVEIT